MAKYKVEAQSHIKKSGFNNFMSSLWGWTQNNKTGKDAGRSPVDFVSVDAGNPDERLTQANIQDKLLPGKLNAKLEELFNAWLNDTSDNLAEISNRAKRVDQLTYATLNDPYIGRVVNLYADEATQLDVQDHIISIESPDPRMTKAMYGLLSAWGITQQRIRSTIYQLACYGDAFWSNKVTENGVEKIIPLKQLQISDRLEFSPVDTLEKVKRREGGLATLSDRYSLIKQMLNDVSETGSFADLFDTKLFGFAITNDLVVPPWAITHFRVGGDCSEYYPFGTSPILGTLAPFKLASSTITLQSIARVLNFPITLYKVKTTENADPGRQFATVDRVREQYDNIGVAPSGNSEVYSVNTKIWMPEGLMDVDVKSPGVDVGFVDDIQMYSDRVATASTVPKNYLIQDWDYGTSAISLIEQNKPFGRSCYSLQTAFLEGLGDLFRLHFAITGQFDFRTPFTLSMKFPAEETSNDKNSTRSSSIELAGSVLDMIRAAVGLQEDEGLPPDVVRDVISKYTFLDPVDVVKWTRDAKFSGASFEGGAGGGGSSGGGGLEDMDLESAMDDAGFGEEDSVGDSLGSLDGEAPAEEAPLPESTKKLNKLQEAKLREKELNVRYSNIRESMYFSVLQENAIPEFIRDKKHVYVSTKPSRGLDEALKQIAKLPKNSNVLREKLNPSLSKLSETDSTN